MDLAYSQDHQLYNLWGPEQMKTQGPLFNNGEFQGSKAGHEAKHRAFYLTWWVFSSSSLPRVLIGTLLEGTAVCPVRLFSSIGTRGHLLYSLGYKPLLLLFGL